MRSKGLCVRGASLPVGSAVFRFPSTRGCVCCCWGAEACRQLLVLRLLRRQLLLLLLQLVPELLWPMLTKVGLGHIP